MSIESPIVVRLRQPGVARINPKLDSNQVPWCNSSCPHHQVVRCALLPLGRVISSERICEPAVHVLVNMATRLADLECGGDA